MIAAIRVLTLSTLFAALLGVGLVHPAGAAPKGSAPASIARRVDTQDDLCMVIGGGRTFAVQYTYNGDGSLASATTKCKGGEYGGRTCTFTQATSDCTDPFMPTDPGATNTTLDGGALATSEPGAPRATVATGAAQVDGDEG